MNIKILHNKYFKLKKSKSVYGSALPKFAIGNRTGNTVKAISYFVICRETLCNYARHKVNYNATNTRILNLLVWFCTPLQAIILKKGKKIILNICLLCIINSFIEHCMF